ncbi:MAG: WYL domain-containing protein [Deltaproteobacteria bacterium]|nr:WYL domain-containing protein [Deltaproteobacteria bacterium]
MPFREIISLAGKNLKTILITAREKDGTIETREAEPYSYRIETGNVYFFCFDIAKTGIRKFRVENIINVSATNNSFSPRWPIEV